MRKGEKTPDWLRKKISQSRKGMTAWNKGIPRDAETKRKLRLILTGQKRSKEFSRRISLVTQGKNNPRWNGGLIKSYRGYLLRHKPDHPNAIMHGKYVYEHRLVVERQIGRTLSRLETVHHINGEKSDNRPENLMCFASNIYHLNFEKKEDSCPKEKIIFDGRSI